MRWFVYVERRNNDDTVMNIGEWRVEGNRRTGEKEMDGGY